MDVFSPEFVYFSHVVQVLQLQLPCFFSLQKLLIDFLQPHTLFHQGFIIFKKFPVDFSQSLQLLPKGLFHRFFFTLDDAFRQFFSDHGGFEMGAGRCHHVGREWFICNRGANLFSRLVCILRQTLNVCEQFLYVVLGRLEIIHNFKNKSAVQLSHPLKSVKMVCAYIDYLGIQFCDFSIIIFYMKKLHVLNITFSNNKRTLSPQQETLDPLPLEVQSDRNPFCEEMLEILSIKGPSKIEKFRQAVDEHKLNQLTSLLKRFQRLESDDPISRKNRDHRRGKENLYRLKKQEKREEDSQSRKDLVDLLNFMKQEIAHKNKIIMEQQSEIIMLRQKNKSKIQKMTRKAIIDDLSTAYKNELSKLMIDAQSFMKRESKSMKMVRGMARKEKVQKPATMENKKMKGNVSQNKFMISRVKNNRDLMKKNYSDDSQDCKKML